MAGNPNSVRAAMAQMRVARDVRNTVLARLADAMSRVRGCREFDDDDVAAMHEALDLADAARKLEGEHHDER